MEILGIDIGGTGIKGAVVDVEKGELVTKRYRLLTPQPATPEAVAARTAKVVEHFEWRGPVGCAFPAVVRRGVAGTAANISKRWIGVNVAQLLKEAAGNEVSVINDADAAGLAEMRFGAGRDQDGVVLIITLGTGIGTALFTDGHLLPNTELGHIEINGGDAEVWAAAIVRKRDQLSWKEWARRLDVYLNKMEALFWPDLIIIGGGASKKHDKFFPQLTVRAKIVPAVMRNEAGIVGAALAALPR
jgi:polyphosphate glucokinase